MSDTVRATVASRMPIERTLRLTTGLILFAFAGTHFISHAVGLFLLDTMEQVGRGIVMAPWRTGVGRWLLLTAFVTHAALGLWALYRRRHLRMPAPEAWQLGLGLLVPLLIIPHAANVRLGQTLYGFDDFYYRIVYQYWISSPATGLPRQFALLVLVWTHGCIGLNFWLRFRPFYRRWRLALLLIALLIPTLAVMGINNAGWDTTLRAVEEPGFALRHGPPPAETPAARQHVALEILWTNGQYAYLALVGLVFVLRELRNRREKRTVHVTYPDGHVVAIPSGFSILEASRWAGVPHASTCGGRGRCSTCRVRVLRGLQDLPSPTDAERPTLERIHATSDVRLACQVRPSADVTVAPLVPVSAEPNALRVAGTEPREAIVTAMFVDLRDSTALALGRLPFDALFLVDRYVQAVTGAVHAHRGYVTSVAGDGVMSVFGLAGDGAGGARDGLNAIASVQRAIAQLNQAVGEEFGGPLRIGIGVHSGLSVVGTVTLRARDSLQFLGNTGNIAARLQDLTKVHACGAIVSRATYEAAGVTPPPGARSADLSLRGADGLTLPAFLLDPAESPLASA